MEVFSSEQNNFAKYLEGQYGTEVATNYVALVTNPGYRKKKSVRNKLKVKVKV